MLVLQYVINSSYSDTFCHIKKVKHPQFIGNLVMKYRKYFQISDVLCQ
jgi:hypothetical protein